MKLSFLFPIIATLLTLANTAAAQAPLDCPSVVAADGVDIAAPADILHQPIAMPGAFGGKVFCSLRPTRQGIEQLFIESIPFDGNITQAFQYFNDAIVYTMRIGAADAQPIEAGGCFSTGQSGFQCYMDLSVGKQVNVSIGYDPTGILTSVGIQVQLGYGVVPPDAWQTLQMVDPTGPDLTLTAFMGTDSTPEMLPLSLEFDETKGRYYFAALGQPAYEFLVAQQNEKFDIVVTTVAELVEKTDSGRSWTTTRYTYDIGASFTAFVMRRVFQLKDLMAAGFEGSKALDFSN